MFRVACFAAAFAFAAPAVPARADEAKADFRLAAKDFAAEAKKDKKAAKAKYKDRTIELTGTVTELGLNISGIPLVLLDGDALTGVLCFPTEPKPWQKMLPGQKVRLIGSAPQFGVATVLDQCSILEVTGDPCPSMTAGALAKEYAADRKAALAKYKDRLIVVEGEVAAKTADDGGVVSVTLKAAGPAAVRCNFGSFDRERTDPIKPGDTVKILGRYWFNNDPKEVLLYSCLWMK